MELMIVVFIIAILVAAAVPSYLDNLKKTRYEESLVALQKMAEANKTFVIQYPNTHIFGPASNAVMTPGACTIPSPGSTGGPEVLYRCGYLIKENWDNLAYQICACNPDTPTNQNNCCCQQGAYAAMNYKNVTTSYCGWINARMELQEPNGGPL